VKNIKQMTVWGLSAFFENILSPKGAHKNSRNGIYEGVWGVRCLGGVMGFRV